MNGHHTISLELIVWCSAMVRFTTVIIAALFQRNDIFGLQAFGAFYNCELDLLALPQNAVAIARDGTKMDKNIFAIFARDKTKTLARAEPLHTARFLRAEFGGSRCSGSGSLFFCAFAQE